MILWIIVVLVILTFFSWLLIKNKILRYTLGTITLALLTLSIVALSANMYDHFGMEKVKTINSKEIYSITANEVPIKAMAVKKISKDNYVLVFRNTKNDMKPSVHFMPNKDDIVETVKKSATYKVGNYKKATVDTTKISWHYKNDLAKTLFDFKDESYLVSEVNEVHLPNNWQIIEK